MSSPDKFFIETWGCQMNELDSERLVGQLQSRGWSRVDRESLADLIVLNTCSIREKAEDKVYSSLGRLVQYKQERPELVIGVAGCVAQQEGTALLDRAPLVDFVLGTGNVEKIADTVSRIRNERKRAALLDFDYENAAYNFHTIAHACRHKAMVTVVEGCDKYCTFCIVPFTRGKERSRPRGEILDEVRRLTEIGEVVEVLLLGQTVNAYCDPESGQGFSHLLREIAKIPGLKRLRFVTSHPKNVTSDMILAMNESAVICRQIHIPPQSGSDRILARMKRQYDAGEYLRIIRSIRNAIPQISISGDVIVGFPGETEDDFDRTLELVREVRFEGLFTFKYSARRGTAATRWEDHIPDETKIERLNRLTELQNSIQLTENQKLIGREMEVLVEGESRRGGGQLMGRTECNRVVNFLSEGETPIGSFRTVRIETAFEHSLLGSLGNLAGAQKGQALNFEGPGFVSSHNASTIEPAAFP